MTFAPVKGVLFDMDNTLIDWSGVTGPWGETERRHLQRVYNFVAEAGRPLNTSFSSFYSAYRERNAQAWAQARTNLRAPKMVELLESMLIHFGFQPDEKISIRDILGAYSWTGAEGVVVFPDVPDALEQITRQGIKVGIVTNASQPMWLRDHELEHYDLLRFFPHQPSRISAADVGYLKPHQQIFTHALEQLGTKPEETLFVGDNPVADIAGAQAAGMRAVLRVIHPAPPLISGLIVPDAAINSFTELLPLIEDWEGSVSLS